MKPLTSRPSICRALFIAACLLPALPSYSQVAGVGPLGYIPLGCYNSVTEVGLIPPFTASIGVPGVKAPAQSGAGPTGAAASLVAPLAYVTNRTASASPNDPFAVVNVVFGAAIASQVPIGTGQLSPQLGPVGTPIAASLYVINQEAGVTETVAGVVTDVPGYAISVIATGLIGLGVGAPPTSAAVVQVIPTDISPVSLAFTSDGSAMYVTHSGSNHVWSIDPVIGTRIASIDVGNRQQGVAVMPFSVAAMGILPSVYVTLPSANAVAVIDIATNTLVATIPVGRDPLAVTMNAPGTTAFVANSADGTVSVIDTATRRITATIPVGLNPSSLSLDVANGLLLVLNEGSGTLSIIATPANTVLDTLQVFLPVNCPVPPSSAALASAGTLSADVAAGGASGSGGIAIGHTGPGSEPLQYISTPADGGVSAVGLYTGVPQPTRNVPASYFLGKGGPFGSERQIAWDPFNQVIWYSAFDGSADHIRSVNPNTGAPGITISTFPGNPVGVIRRVFIDDAGQRLISPNSDGSVSLFSLATGAPAGLIPAGFFADGSTSMVRGFAADPRTGNVWYAAADGSFREMTMSPKFALTGRSIPFASQTGQNPGVNNRGYFFVDSNLNELVYQPYVFGGVVTLASISLDTLAATGDTRGIETNDGTSPTTLINAGQCQLTVTALPPAAGSVVTGPSANGNGFFACGAAITVRAIANPGYQFSNFSGDLSGPANPQTITMNAGMSVTANFTTAQPIGVSVTPSAVTLLPGQTQKFSATVTNTANTAVAWSLVSGPGAIDANGVYTAPAQVTASQTAVVKAISLADVTRSATATIQIQVQSTSITISTTPAGLAFSVDGSAPQPAPQTLTLAAGAHTIAVAAVQPGAAGVQYVFVAWNDNGAASHTITVGASPATFTATFAVQYQLTTSVSPSGAGTVTASPASSSGYYNTGTSVQLAASAHAGDPFSNWSGDLSGAANPQTIVMNAPHSVTANFTTAAACTFTFTPPSASLPATGTSTPEACPNHSGQGACGVGPEVPVTFAVTPSASCGTWTATSSNPAVLQITLGASGSGPATIAFTVLSNTHSAPQSYAITVAGAGGAASYPVTEAGSPDSEVYREVYALYEQLLGRDPEPAGFAFWTGSGGAGLGQMADSFLTSPEAYDTDFAVMASYQAATGSAPTFAQYNAAASAIRANTQTVPGLFNSLIGGSFSATNLYQNLLGRAPGAGDSACINSGLSTCFQTIIGYPSSTTPVGAGNNEFQSTGTYHTTLTADHTNGLYVQMIYYVTLSRDPDPAGLAFWTGIANSGGPGLLFQGNAGFATRTQILGPGTPNQGFIGSPEFQGLFAN